MPLSLPSRRATTQAGERSGFAQQIIAQQIIEPPSPGFVGVAANVDAPGELHLTGFGILHVACEDLNTLRCGKLSRIELEMPGEFLVQPD